MSDLIITPSSGKIDFIYQSGQEISRLESITIDPTEGLVFSGKISASSVTAPLNVTATSSNINYPFVFASSGTTGAKSLLMDSAGGTYNPSTNLATIDISGTSSWATNAVTNANLTGDVTSVGNATTIANSVVTNAKLANSSVTIGSTAISLGATPTVSIAGLTSVTSTTFVGALTGTATTASYANALNAANSYTVTGITGALTGTSSWATNATNALQLGGVAAVSYVTLTGTQTLTGKTITGTFTGNLTGTSSWASNAVTANALSSMNISQFTNNSSYQYHRGDITSLSSSATNLVQPLGTFDGQSITNAPTSGWYNYLSSTHASYLTSLIANLHRTADWYVGYKEGPGGTPTNPTWYKLLHSGNYTDYTVTKTGTGASGNWTITSSWATNALTATQLNGQAASYYTNIPARLGYTPVDKAGDTVTGNLIINGNFSVNGSFTAFSASNVYISSSQLYIEDNILTLNAFSPYLRYAGIEMYDSGSGTLSSLLWDGESDYFFLTGSSVNGKIITGPDSQANLSANFVPKATAGYKLGNSIIYDNGTSVGIGTTTVNQKVSIYPGTTGGISLQDIDSETRAYFFIDNTNPTYSTGIRTQNYYLDFDSSGGSQNAIRFYTGTSTIGTGTERMRIISNGNVGIGTNTPGALFEISSSTVASLLNVKGAGGNGLLFVSGSGNVGIGTTSPAAKLQVNSTTAGATLLRTDGTNGTLFSVVDDLSDSLMSVNNSAGLPVLEVFADDRIVMGQYGQNDFVLVNNKVGIGTNNPVAELHVTASSNIPAAVFIGDVGIGTTAPTAQSNYRFLQVNGTNSAIIETMVGGARIGGFDSTSNTLYVGSIGSYPIVFRTAVDEKMRIAANGNVGIGTSSPAQKLEVQSGSVLIRGDGTALFGTYYASAGENTFFTMHSGSGNTFHIGNDVSGTNYTTMVFTAATDSTGGKVGIGTTNPVAKLQVAGNISGSSFTSSISNAVGFLGTSSWATNATNALQLGGTAAADYVTLTGTQTLTGKTITGTFTGNLTGTATTASYANALNAANSYTVVGITGNLTGNVTGTATTASYANALNAANSYTVAGITGALTGTSSWATNATNALQLGGTAAASYVTLTGTQTLTGKTITGTFTGNLTGTSSWASNAVTALNGGVTSVSGTANQVIVSGNTGAVTFSLPQSIHTTATPTFTSVSATTFTGNLTGTATTASYANALNPANSYTVTGITGALTGTSSWASNAVTANALSSMNISQFTNNSNYQYHRGDITSLSSSATNVVQPLGTFDGQSITNAPTSGWYNYLSSTHGSYLTSLIANLHRTADWYVGYKEGPGGTPTNPTWYKLLHSGNYSSYTNLTASWASNAVTALACTGNAGTVTNGVYTTGNQSIAGTKTFTGVTSFSNTSDYQIVLDGSGGTWAGINWSDVNGVDNMWFNGQNKTFSIGGVGSNVSGKKLHVDGGVTIGADYDATVVPSNGLSIQGGVQIGNYSTYVINALGASGTQSRTFEIARLGIDYNDWNNIGTFEVEIHEKYYSKGLKKVYNIWYGYNSNSGIRLVELRGTGDNNFQCRIGSQVQISGDSYYLPVFIDVTYYSSVDVVIKTNRNITTTTNPEIGYTYINIVPTPTNISSFTADSDLEISTLASAKLGGNTILTTATTSATGLSIGGTAATASYANALNAANSYTVTNLTASGVGKFFGNIAIITDASANDYSLIGHSYAGTTKAFTGYNGGSAIYGGESTIPTRIQAGGQYAISVLANGNVGIGTTSPLSKLHISGSGQTIMRLDSDTTTNVSQFQIKAASDAVLIMGMFGGSATGNNYGVTAAGQAYIGTTTLGSPHPTSLVIATASPIPTIFSTNNVERMRIDGTGLVGIGTSIPSTLLHAYGSDGRYFTYSGTSGAFTIQRNAITTGGATPVLSLINTQGMDSSTGRGTSIQLDLGYGGSSSAVGTAARGARIATLGETVYDATAANQNAVLAFFTSTAGTLTEKLRIRSDGSLSPITVSSTTAGATLLRTDGTNGTLFSVVDDLSDSLMSVNNSAGLPVLEVFADDRIVAGQYGQNDFVVVNNKVGIGTNNPLAKLHVTGSSSVPAAVLMGNVGIGTTSFVYSNANRGLLEIYGSSDALISLRNATANSYLQKTGNDFYFNNGGAGFISIATNGSERMFIKSDGNVGIGTSVPTARVDTLGVRIGRDFSIANRATVRLDSNDTSYPSDVLFGHTVAANQDSWNGVYWSLSSRAAADGNKFYFYRGSGNPAPNNSEAIIMTFDPNLNVGIGITSPTTKLHVVGVISGSSFTGAGTGLTGTAANLTVGTASALSSMNISQFTNNSGYLTSVTNISGNAATATIVNGTNGQLLFKDIRTIAPNNITAGYLQFGFTAWNNNGDTGGIYADYLHLRSYTDSSGGLDNLLMFRKVGGLGIRLWQQTFGSATAYATYKDVCWTDGTNASGNWSITSSWASNAVTSLACTGNAATVTTNANLTGHITSTGNATILGSFTSAQLLAALTDETGTGASVFANSPTLVTPALGTPSSGVLTNCTGTAANLTAGTVTNGVYTTGNQSIAGNKTFTGTTIVTGSIETAAVRETFSAVSSTTTVSIDLSTATVFNLTFTSTISAFNITNVNTSRVNSFTLITAPNGTGATIAWSFQTNGGVAANVKWASNVSPTATTTTGRFDIFSFVYNGANWYGFTGGQNYV